MKPLEGIRVVELAMWVAGPAIGGILADWGAEVIKIEPPGGDPMRNVNQNFLGGSEPRSPAFDLDNRGKRSIVVDLAQPSGVDLVDRLVGRADVFLTNTRLSSLDRMGLDHASMLERHPRLVYALLSAHGSEGPARNQSGYDAGAFWAWGGAAARFTAEGQEPPALPGAFGDHIASMSGVAAVVAGLYARDRQGKGQFVSTSLIRSGMYTVSGDVATRLTLGRMAKVATRRTIRNPLMNSYPSKDGRWFWLLGAESQRHWPGLTKAIGAPELSDDPRFTSPNSRRRHVEDLVTILDGIFLTKDRDEWARCFAEHDVWWAPVNTVDDLLEDPQVAAAGAFVSMRDRDSGGLLPVPAGPVDFGGPDSSMVLEPAPAVGEHAREILGLLDLDEGERDQLLADRIVHAP